MHYLWKQCFFASLLLSSPQVSSQSNDGQWNVGAISLLYDSPFGQEKTQVRFFPSITYQSKGLYLQGLEAGYHLLNPDYRNDLQLSADIFVAARGVAGQFRSEFALDAGVRGRVSNRFGILTAEFRQDVTGKYNGQEVSLDYGYRFVAGDLVFIPSVRATWQSRKLSNFIYGVTAEQRQNMLENEQPLLPLFTVQESSINYSANIFSTYQLTRRISVIGFGGVTLLPEQVTNNPGITKDYEITAALGVSYSF